MPTSRDQDRVSGTCNREGASNRLAPVNHAFIVDADLAAGCDESGFHLGDDRDWFLIVWIVRSDDREVGVMGEYLAESGSVPSVATASVAEDSDDATWRCWSEFLEHMGKRIRRVGEIDDH